ncbi:hypothetical protein trd_A0135 (plasmid) [Thermomicrobium roseum DSM 5159]|uniref:Uncharacterized protein n=1 Tax=Thermomicrobium roseum (strain ATCC 27502 / DSM 5159 / P-2) TaxID=309801 RepID=B9L2X1_THERP|nr:hypothetical protein trd_A0135 [Thermomicrobium roseum DSM 5159]
MELSREAKRRARPCFAWPAADRPARLFVRPNSLAVVGR